MATTSQGGSRTEGQDWGDGDLNHLKSLEYPERMTHFIRGSTRHVSRGVTVLDFRPLYAVTIHHIQRQLAKEISLISESYVTDDQLETIRQLLGKYTKALQDFEYIHANRWYTDFVKDIAASRIDNGPGSTFQAALLEELELTLPDQRQLLYSDEDLLSSFNGHLKPQAPTRGTKRRVWLAADKKREGKRIAVRRLLFAMLGGLAIIVPVLVMAIPTASAKKVVTVRVSITLFVFSMTVFSSASPENLLAASAAYAAVLVAFMGN